MVHDTKGYYAHTDDSKPWEPLEDHLRVVESLARTFAGAFDAEAWGAIAGAWHDLGKYSDAFQAYLRGGALQETTLTPGDRVDHSTAGAQWSVQKDGTLGRLLAHVVAGHHAGLLDFEGGGGLRHRLEKRIEPYLPSTPSHILDRELPAPPSLLPTASGGDMAFRVAFWIRMLFSCLVDADFLATEAFMNPEQSTARPVSDGILASMRGSLDAHLDHLAAAADVSEVNGQRQAILAACRDAADAEPGFFDLCVPTGGGKTLASLAFGLRHATRHGMRRVIVGIPFTSIIEQNARVYREMFDHLGDGVVLEHHSNTDPVEETYTNRLQAENWDAPLVVTTNVQLFESLFAARTSQCRKLHRISRSVIILDEVQAIPVEILQPTLLALRELVAVYGCTVVLCTATQPAFGKTKTLPFGLEGVRPILPDAARVYEAMTRVSVEVDGVVADPELIERLLAEEQVLCIVNSRPHAASLFASLGEDDGHFHLSTRMCAAHRLSTLAVIRMALREGRRCRVVSTQLVEAGVDLDFPVVYRAICGIDSLAQAAGRCNREGRLAKGRVVWFQTETPPPPGFLRHAADAAKACLTLHDDPLSLNCIHTYFRELYFKNADRMDCKGVLAAHGKSPGTMQFPFRHIASLYRFIESDETTVFVPWRGEGGALLEMFKTSFLPDRGLLRRLQPYGVGVRRGELRRLLDAGAVTVHHERYILVQGDLYREGCGLTSPADLTAEDCVV